MSKIVYRIKDLNTGKYYSKREWCVEKGGNFYESLAKTADYKYEAPNRYNRTRHTFLYFNHTGLFYPTKKGAEKIISEISGCRLKDRKTPAGRLFNSQYNFIVVKSEITARDINETENVSVGAENQPEITKQV